MSGALTFETFAERVNDWIKSEPASEREILSVWSLGAHEPPVAAAQIERVRELAAASRVPFGEIITGSLLIPVGIALVALISLADEADAATVLVATREGVLATAFLASLCALVVGVIVGWLTSPFKRSAETPFVDHPDFMRARDAGRTRVRS